AARPLRQVRRRYSRQQIARREPESPSPELPDQRRRSAALPQVHIAPPSVPPATRDEQRLERARSRRPIFRWKQKRPPQQRRQSCAAPHSQTKPPTASAPLSPAPRFRKS